jgi:hypothetical protein
MRNPSCLISCNQPGPEGGAFAGDGRHGSIIPSPGRVRSRNDMGGFNRCGDLKSRGDIHEKLMGLARLTSYSRFLRTGVRVLVPDYVAIGVLIFLVVWAVADWLPRGKL